MNKLNNLIAVKNLGNRFKVEYVTTRPDNLIAFMQSFGNGCQMAATDKYVYRGMVVNGCDFMTMEQYQQQKKEETAQSRKKAIQY